MRYLHRNMYWTEWIVCVCVRVCAIDLASAITFNPTAWLYSFQAQAQLEDCNCDMFVAALQPHESVIFCCHFGKAVCECEQWWFFDIFRFTDLILVCSWQTMNPFSLRVWMFIFRDEHFHEQWLFAFRISISRRCFESVRTKWKTHTQTIGTHPIKGNLLLVSAVAAFQAFLFIYLFFLCFCSFFLYSMQS